MDNNKKTKEQHLEEAIKTLLQIISYGSLLTIICIVGGWVLEYTPLIIYTIIGHTLLTIFSAIILIKMAYLKRKIKEESKSAQ